MSFIVKNSIQTPDGTILTSCHRHDYRTHLDKNGEVYMVDGGLDYLRRSVNKEPAIELSVYSDDDFEVVREAFLWGTYGKNGDEKLRRVPLKDLTTNHIIAILKLDFRPHIKELFEKELEYRG